MTDTPNPALTDPSDAATSSDARQTSAADSATESDSLSKDTLFELVRNQRRRDAVSYLRACGGSTTLSDMAEHIAAKENDIEVGQLTSKQRKRVYVGLYQCHLPKLNVAGVIDYDRNRGTIELNQLARELVPYLDGDEESQTGSESEPLLAGDATTETSEAAAGAESDGSIRDPVTLGAVAVGVVSVLGSVGAPVLSTVPAAGWTVLCAAALVGVALRDVWER